MAINTNLSSSSSGVGGDKYELVEFEFYRGPTFIAGQVGHIAAFDRQAFLHQCTAAYAAVLVEGLGIAIEVGIVEPRALGDVAQQIAVTPALRCAVEFLQ